MLGETRYHQQATGAKAGYWVVCNAKNACRLGGEHIDRQAADFINTQTDAKAREAAKAADEATIAAIKAELAEIDANATTGLTLPDGVSVNTVSTLEYSYEALSEEAKEAAYENWLTTHYFDAEIDAITNTLLEDEGSRIEGFTPRAIIGLDIDGYASVSFQGQFNFTPEEADALIAELSEEDLEELEVYAGYESTEDVKDALVRSGVSFVYPKRYTEGVYTNTVDFSDSELVDTETFQNKIKEQADKYLDVANAEYDYAISKEYFEEFVADNETFSETGEIN